MVRVVADTNIYISALVFGGKPMEFLRMARARRFELAVSEDIIAEVAHVLRDKFGWPAVDVGDAYDTIIGCTRRVEPTERLSVIKEDPDDDRILECAVAARAEALVSRDNDLLRLKEFRHIPMMTLADFLVALERGAMPSPPRRGRGR